MIQAGAADEQVALYDPQTGRPAGSAPRSVVRRDNLPHGATAVLVRRTDGQLFVHRRSDGKDLWPGWHDCAAGGVIRPGEDPAAAAGRELAEELGVPVAVPGAAPARGRVGDCSRCIDVTWRRSACAESLQGATRLSNRVVKHYVAPPDCFVGRTLLAMTADWIIW